MEVKYTNELPVKDFNRLRKTVGWKEINESQALRGIQNSFFIVSAIYGEEVIGFARVISDGGYVIIIAEVVVLPEYQGKGIGKGMMKRAMDYINNSIYEGQCVIVGLLASKDRESFYIPFGFETRPNDELGAGMTQWMYPK